MSEIMLLESEKKLQKQNEVYERLNNDLKVAVEKAEENDRLKTAFLHNISHEIRTPMNAIIGFSGILNDPDISRQKADSYLEIITKSGYQLLSIIDDIVKIATIEAGQVRINKDSFNLNSVLKLQYGQFSDKAREKSINFNYVTGLPDHESEIITDKIKIEEILNNLIGNALKFTSKGSIEFGYQIKGGIIEFYVADTGIGIADSLHKEIFERFRQAEVNISREYGGSGLGLSISKSYVEILGGKIWLESRQGEGSVFYFTLPHVKVNLKDKSSHVFGPGEAIVLKGTKTILIAEDEDFNYLFLEEVLLKHKLKLMRAVNGKEAVNMCEKYSSIDLVLMDIKMPVMDGYQATQKIKVLRPKLPVILQTAITQDSDLQKACENGCNDYIIKPIVKNELLRLLKKYL
jgi:CheY-like chemotaxis protein/nitrogen-specific signal transduction histidine kinase